MAKENKGAPLCPPPSVCLPACRVCSLPVKVHSSGLGFLLHLYEFTFRGDTPQSPLGSGQGPVLSPLCPQPHSNTNKLSPCSHKVPLSQRNLLRAWGGRIPASVSSPRHVCWLTLVSWIGPERQKYPLAIFDVGFAMNEPFYLWKMSVCCIVQSVYQTKCGVKGLHIRKQNHHDMHNTLIRKWKSFSLTYQRDKWPLQALDITFIFYCFFSNSVFHYFAQGFHAK